MSVVFIFSSWFLARCQRSFWHFVWYAQDSAVLRIEHFVIPGICRTRSSSSAAASGFSVASETSGALTLHFLSGSSFSPWCFSSSSDSSLRIISLPSFSPRLCSAQIQRFHTSCYTASDRWWGEVMEFLFHLTETHTVPPHTLPSLWFNMEKVPQSFPTYFRRFSCFLRTFFLKHLNSMAATFVISTSGSVTLAFVWWDHSVSSVLTTQWR